MELVNSDKSIKICPLSSALSMIFVLHFFQILILVNMHHRALCFDSPKVSFKLKKILLHTNKHQLTRNIFKIKIGEIFWDRPEIEDYESLQNLGEHLFMFLKSFI